MARSKTSKLKLRPTAEILDAHSALLRALYTSGVDLPDDILGGYEALCWVLNINNGRGGFAGALAQVQETMKQVAAAPPPAPPAPSVETAGTLPLGEP